LPAYVHPPLSPEAIATHPHKPHTFDKKAPPGMKNAHLLVLFSLYASASTSLAAFVLPSTAAAASLLGTVWLSFVLAISFTEAWVKFKAPTLSKAAAVDAGRHVFAALNAVESGLAVALAAALFLATPRPLLLLAPSPASPLDSWRRLAAVPLLALAFQVSWLTPQLDRRARELIVSSWRRKKEKKKEGVKEERENRGDGDEQKARAAVLEMELRDKGTPVPPAWLHAIYVALEAVKVVSLALLVKSAGRGAFV